MIIYHCLNRNLKTKSNCLRQNEHQSIANVNYNKAAHLNLAVLFSINCPPTYQSIDQQQAESFFTTIPLFLSNPNQINLNEDMLHTKQSTN